MESDIQAAAAAAAAANYLQEGTKKELFSLLYITKGRQKKANVIRERQRERQEETDATMSSKGTKPEKTK